MIADRARCEAVLTDGSKDACVYARASRLDDLQVRRLTSLIDDHPHNDLAVVVEQASGASGICYDIYGVNQLGSDYSSRNALACGAGPLVATWVWAGVLAWA